MVFDGVCFNDSYPSQKQIFEKEFPLPPSINSYWKLNKQSGHLYVSNEGHVFRAAVKAAVGEGLVPLKCRLAIDVVMVPPDHRRRDVDNIQKALLDALQKAAVYVDDSQIDDIRIRRAMVDRSKGRILVRLYRLSEDLAPEVFTTPDPPAPSTLPVRRSTFTPEIKSASSALLASQS